MSGVLHPGYKLESPEELAHQFQLLSRWPSLLPSSRRGQALFCPRTFALALLLPGTPLSGVSWGLSKTLEVLILEKTGCSHLPAVGSPALKLSAHPKVTSPDRPLFPSFLMALPAS